MNASMHEYQKRPKPAHGFVQAQERDRTAGFGKRGTVMNENGDQAWAARRGHYGIAAIAPVWVSPLSPD